MSMGADRPWTSGVDQRWAASSASAARDVPPLALYTDRTIRFDDCFGDRQPPAGDCSSPTVVPAAVAPPAAHLRPHTTGTLANSNTGTATAHRWFSSALPEFPYSAQNALAFHKTSRVSKGITARRALILEQERKETEMKTKTAATLKIQALFREKKARRRYKAEQKVEEERLQREDARREAATKIQAVFRGRRDRHMQKMKRKKKKNRKQRKQTHRLAKQQRKAHRQTRKAERNRHHARNKQKKAKRAHKVAEEARLAAEAEAMQAKQAAEQAEQAAQAARRRIRERNLKAERQRKERAAAQRRQNLMSAAKEQKTATEMQSKSLSRYESVRRQIAAEDGNHSAQAQATATAKAREDEATSQRTEALALFAEQCDPMDPKPMLLVQRQITRLLEAKVIDDTNRDQSSHVRQSFPGFVFQYFKEYYGLEIAKRNLLVLREGVREYATRDDATLIQLFGQLSGMLDDAADAIASEASPHHTVGFASSTCDFILDVLGELIPNHKAIDETLHDKDCVVATNDAMQAFSAGDTLRELTLPADLHKQLRDTLRNELEKFAKHHEGSHQLHVQDCLDIGFNCWYKVMMQPGVAEEIERYRASPEIRKQALKRIMHKEIDAVGAIDVMQMLKQKHDEDLERLQQATQGRDNAQMELEAAVIAAEALCAEEEAAAAELEHLEQLEFEAREHASQAEVRASKRREEESDRKLALNEVEQVINQADAAYEEALNKEYEAIQNLERVEEEQQREEDQELKNNLAAAKADDEKVRSKLNKELQEAEDAQLKAEKERQEEQEAARIYAKEQQEAQQALEQREKEQAEYKEAEKAVQLQELKAFNVRTRAEEQFAVVQDAITFRAKAHQRLENERKDAKNAAYSRRSTTKRQQAMAAAEEEDLHAATKLQAENDKYKLLDEAANKEEAILMECRKALSKELAEAKAAEANYEKEEREAKAAKVRLDIEAAERRAAETKADHEKAELDQARAEFEEHEKNKRALIRNRLKNSFELVRARVRTKRKQKQEADDKIEQARLKGEELLKEELVRTHQMDEDTFEQVRQKAESWKHANPDGNADILDLIAAWVYSMGPGGHPPNFCECEFQQINGPPPWKGEPKGSCTCKPSARNFRIYPDLNRSMRSITIAGRAQPKFEWLHYHLTQACEHIPGAPSGQKLYRGQPKLYGEEYDVGEIIRWNDYKSTSTNRSAAEDFSGDTGIRFTIVEIPPDFGANFHTSPPLSAWPNEDEILLPAGATFRVKRHDTDCCCRIAEDRRGIICCCRDTKGRQLRTEEPSHSHPHEIILEYMGQWYEDPNAAFKKRRENDSTCGCFGRMQAARKAQSDNKYEVITHSSTKTNVGPTSSQPTLRVDTWEPERDPEQELQQVLSPEPQSSSIDATVKRPTLHASRSMVDTMSQEIRKQHELKVMSEHFPLRFELVGREQQHMPPELYDSIEKKMKHWLHNWRSDSSSVAHNGTMRLEDAIAAWAYSMGGSPRANTEEESIIPAEGSREHKIGHAFCIRDIFHENMTIATKRGTQPRSLWFEDEWGRFWKHLKNAISAGTWQNGELYLGWGAKEWQQRQSLYEIGSSVTWLQFVQTTTDREQAATRAGKNGAVIIMKGLPEQAGANFAMMRLSPWGKRLQDVLLVPGIQLRVMKRNPPKAARRRTGGGGRDYSLLSLEFEALHRARARVPGGGDKDTSSESEWDESDTSEEDSEDSFVSDDDGDERLTQPLPGTPMSSDFAL